MFQALYKYKSNCSIHNSNVIDYLKINKGMSQDEIAEKLNEKFPKRKINQATVSRYKSLINESDKRAIFSYPPLGKLPRDIEIELLKMADLYWDLTPEANTETFDSKWNTFVQSKENENDWYKYFDSLKFFKNKAFLDCYRQGGKYIYERYIREYLLLLNKCCFEFPSINKEFMKEDNFVELTNRWAKNLIELQEWWFDSVPEQLQQDRSFVEFYNNDLYRVAFGQIIADEEFEAEGLKYSFNLRYELEDVTQKAFQVFRTLLFVANHKKLVEDQAGESIDLPRFDIKRILVKHDLDLTIKNSEPGYIDGSDVDRSQWSNADQEIYDLILSMKKYLYKGF